MSSCHRCRSCGGLSWRWLVVGEGPCTCPRARHAAPSTEGRGGMGSGRVWRWAPGPTRLRFVPVPSVACVPPARVRVLGPLPRRVRPARGCVLCALGLVRLSPRSPFLGGVPTAGGIAGALFPSSGLRKGPCLAGLVSLSGGGRLFGEDRRLAASGASSDVGTRCRSRVFVGRHRCVRTGSSLVSCWRLLGLPGELLVSGRLGCRRRAWWDCTGSVRCDSRPLASRCLIADPSGLSGLPL